MQISKKRKITKMNQDSSNLLHEPFFTIPQSQTNPNPPPGDNDLYRFLMMPRISSHSKEYNLVDPLDGSILGLTRSSECHEPVSVINHSSSKLHFLNDSLVVIKPLMSSKTSHLPTSQVTEKSTSISNMETAKEVISNGTDVTVTAGNNHIERPVPKKPHILSDGQDQFTTGYNDFSLPLIQTSRKINGGENDTSVSSTTVSKTTETDNEIIALRARIDSLYSKLNEIQQKRDTTNQYLRENEESKLNNRNGIININEDKSGYLKIANESGESVSCTIKRNLQINQLVANSSQNEEGTLLQHINEECPLNSGEVKTLELSRQLCDTYENNDQFGKVACQMPQNFSGTYQPKSSNGMETNEDIILVDCSQEMTEVQVKNNDRNSVSNHLGKCNSESSTKTNINSGTSKNCESRPSDKMLQQKAGKLKEQYRNSASRKMETKDTIITMKRIQEFWDATYLSPHIRKIKKNLDTSIQSKKVIQSTRPCFPPANRVTQTPTSIMKFQQPRTISQPPVQFGPMLCFPNISTSAENYPNFANPFNPFSQPQFLTSNQLSKPLLPTMTTPIQAFQRHTNPLLNVHFPTVGNAISTTQNLPTNYSLSHNGYATGHKLLFKNRLVFDYSKFLENSPKISV